KHQNEGYMQKKKPTFEELNIPDNQKIKVIDFLKDGYNQNKLYYERIKYLCNQMCEVIDNNETQKLQNVYPNFVKTFNEICNFDDEFKVFDIKNLNKITLMEIRDFSLIRLSSVDVCLETCEKERMKIDAKIFPDTIQHPNENKEYQKLIKINNAKRDLMVKAYNNKESLEEFDK
ncbi:MAG: hypothetical protein PHS54_01865, partial [Clostridia bacterium]|nr:hypothetical protein [Clostridia bacterium]